MRSTLAVVALTLVVFVVAAEVLLRATCTYCTYTERNGGAYRSPYAPRPNATWYYLIHPERAGPSTKPEFDFETRINSLGFRDVEPALEKPPGTFRIIGIGDSFTQGVGAAFEDTYLQVLQHDLNASGDLVDVAVMSAGVAGSDPLFGFLLLRDKLLGFEPDLVTLTINSSDFNDVVFRGGKERFVSDGTLQYREPPGDEWLYEHSHFYRFIKMGVLGYDWLHLRDAERKRRTLGAVDDLEEAITDYRDLAHKEGFAFVVILHPMRNELIKERYDLGFEELTEYLEAEEIPFVDLPSYFHTYLDEHDVPPSSLYWEIDAHHNAQGYALFAKGLEAYLRAHDMIPARSTVEASN